jgi:hypothetical protein
MTYNEEFIQEAVLRLLSGRPFYFEVAGREGYPMKPPPWKNQYL